ncbi:glycosyltransferase [Nitrospina gracilis]|uniref:glycosyltransferase n=1 Tax=Nitrospina gracilis TaxID=35801 RepID=UPI001F324228
MSTHGTLLPGAGRKDGFPPRLHDLLTLKTAIRRADAVVVGSKAEFDEARQIGVDAARLHIIPPGIDVIHPPPPAPASRHALRLLYVGAFHTNRRLELILRAARNLTVPFAIDLAEWGGPTAEADAYVESVKKLSKVLGVEDRLHIHRANERKDLDRLYRTADVFVYPVGHEPLGLPLLEAAAYGLPIVSTPAGLTQDLVVAGETGFVVPADPDTIGDRIMKLSNAETRQAFRDRIRAQVRDHFGWNHITQRTLHLYQSLLR